MSTKLIQHKFYLWREIYYNYVEFPVVAYMANIYVKIYFILEGS